MCYKRIWLGTSKNSKLNRFYLLNTGKKERQLIRESIGEDLNFIAEEKKSINKLEQNALIEDIPYFVKFDDINQKSYLFQFKGKVEELLSSQRKKVIQFSKNPLKIGQITNLDKEEGIKCIIIQSDNNLFFLYSTPNRILKNKWILTTDITEDSVVLKVPRGIQIPEKITAEYDINEKILYVYDVNKFENMLLISENRELKSINVIEKFKSKEYTVGSEGYTVNGLDQESVAEELFKSKRAVRRLAKYEQPKEKYSIDQIKKANSKLDEKFQIPINDRAKTINVTPESVRTFVAILHNTIIQRLISGDVEITI